ncbi:rhamnulokinase [Pseudalkalibacillus salsuginis]|uniref:rhamnulokinase n=1 Tax=Pseudalkalibacillus salsuginis TaxID=2910972 RepID=UPI001F3F85D4|nr:rhamnulokinase family protein [Pseudalkalibacillus salsuginis]MCF6411389.1 rhamnulokinase [Pseudalkalibacillus salsuginis]
MTTVLGYDLGASSGRVVLGKLEDHHLEITEIHRFSNDPVQVNKHLYWDILRLFHEMKRGLVLTVNAGYQSIDSLAIDSWAVDFGLIDETGHLLSNPIHYRDNQTDKMMEEVFEIVPKEEIFKRTGIQFMKINTIYHLFAMKKNNPHLLDRAEALLMIPDLLRYFFTGIKCSEYTNATTTQLFNPTRRKWDEYLLNKLGLNNKLFLEPVQPGTKIGELLPSICKEVGLKKPISVMTVGEHDTASAVAAVPSTSEDFAYLSCGTWSLLGTETKEPVITKKALEYNVTNEGGVEGTNRLLKNIMGLWLIQECRRVWELEGDPVSYEEQKEWVEQSPAFTSFIDPDNPVFIRPAHMPEEVQRYCAETGQPIPETKGEILRCILESMALKYRFVLERMESLVNKRIPVFHMVGGGIQNELLCQFTANALGRQVKAGPVEATAIGNILMQYKGMGKIKDLTEIRAIVQNSFSIKTYIPNSSAQWEDVYETFKRFIEE